MKRTSRLLIWTALFAACGPAASNSTTTGGTTGSTGSTAGTTSGTPGGTTGATAGATTGATAGATTGGGGANPTIAANSAFDPAAWIRGTATIPLDVGLDGASSGSVAGTINGIEVCTDDTAPFECAFNSSGQDGTPTLTLTVTTAGGNASVDLALKIDNVVPTVSVAFTGTGAVIYSKAPNLLTVHVNDTDSLFNASADDTGSGIATVDVLARAAGTSDAFAIIASTTDGSGSAFTIELSDLSAYPDGDYDLKLRVTDDAGNTNESAALTVVLDHVGPTVGVSLSSPASPIGNPPAVSQSITLTINAADAGVGLGSVQVFRVGTPNTLLNCVPSVSLTPGDREYQVDCELDTVGESLADGTIDIIVTATQVDANATNLPEATATTTAELSLRVDNNPPSVEWVTTLPANMPQFPVFVLKADEPISFGDLGFVQSTDTQCTNLSTPMEATSWDTGTFELNDEYYVWLSMKTGLLTNEGNYDWHFCASAFVVKDDAGNVDTDDFVTQLSKRPVLEGGELPLNFYWAMEPMTGSGLDGPYGMSSLNRARTVHTYDLDPGVVALPPLSRIEISGDYPISSVSNCRVRGVLQEEVQVNCFTLNNKAYIEGDGYGFLPDAYRVEAELVVQGRSHQVRDIVSIVSTAHIDREPPVLSLMRNTIEPSDSILIGVSEPLSGSALGQVAIDNGDIVVDLMYEPESAVLILIPRSALSPGEHVINVSAIRDTHGVSTLQSDLIFTVNAAAAPTAATAPKVYAIGQQSTLWVQLDSRVRARTLDSQLDYRLIADFAADAGDGRVPLYGLTQRTTGFTDSYASNLAFDLNTSRVHIDAALTNLVLELPRLQTVNGDTLPSLDVPVAHQAGDSSAIPSWSRLEANFAVGPAKDAAPDQFAPHGALAARVLSLRAEVRDNCLEGPGPNPPANELTFDVVIDEEPAFTNVAWSVSGNPAGDACSYRLDFMFGGEASDSAIWVDTSNPDIIAQQAALAALSNGWHTVTLTAYDSANNRARATRAFYSVDGYPTLVSTIDDGTWGFAFDVGPIGVASVNVDNQVELENGRFLTRFEAPTFDESEVLGVYATRRSTELNGFKPVPLTLATGPSLVWEGTNSSDLPLIPFARSIQSGVAYVGIDFGGSPTRVIAESALIDGRFWDGNNLFASDFSSHADATAAATISAGWPFFAQPERLELGDATFAVAPTENLPNVSYSALRCDDGQAPRMEVDWDLSTSAITLQAWVIPKGDPHPEPAPLPGGLSDYSGVIAIVSPPPPFLPANEPMHAFGFARDVSGTQDRLAAVHVRAGGMNSFIPYYYEYSGELLDQDKAAFMAFTWNALEGGRFFVDGTSYVATETMGTPTTVYETGDMLLCPGMTGIIDDAVVSLVSRDQIYLNNMMNVRDKP